MDRRNALPTHLQKHRHRDLGGGSDRFDLRRNAHYEKPLTAPQRIDGTEILNLAFVKNILHNIARLLDKSKNYARSHLLVHL